MDRFTLDNIREKLIREAEKNCQDMVNLNVGNDSFINELQKIKIIREVEIQRFYKEVITKIKGEC